MTEKPDLEKILETIATKSTDYKLFSSRYLVNLIPDKSGAFGKVLLGYDLLSQKSIAVKKLSSVDAAKYEHMIMESYGSNEFLPKAYDFFAENNEGYIVMERIDSAQLGNHLRGEKREKGKAVRITMNTLRGLRHLHTKGFLHTDIQPKNLLINEDRSATLKIIDFGCAVKKKGRVWKGKPNGGTWEYMPPEQFEELAVLDESSDVYEAAGVCIYLITGKAPFLPSFDNSPTVWKEYRAECQRLHSMQPDFTTADKALESILLKATNPDKTKRYQTAQEMIDALK